MCRKDLSSFAAGHDPSLPSQLRQHPTAALATCIVDEQKASVTPSRHMLTAADAMQHLLRVLGNHLDAVVFRDVWKAMAVAVNYAMFNDVATEAPFSPQVRGRMRLA